MVTLLWKLIQPYIYTYLFLEINKRNANHARETAPTFNCWRFSWNSQHFKKNRSPLMGLEPTTSRLHADYTYVYKCICGYIFVGTVTLQHTFYANIHIKLDRHARQTAKSIIWWEVIYVINRPQNEGVPLISQLASRFFGFSIHQNPYIPNLVLSAKNEDPCRVLSHICYTNQISLTLIIFNLSMDK